MVREIEMQFLFVIAKDGNIFLSYVLSFLAAESENLPVGCRWGKLIR